MMSLLRSHVLITDVIHIGKNVAEFIKEKIPYQPELTGDRIQVVRWIERMKSVCRIESKWYVIVTITADEQFSLDSFCYV